MQYSSWVLYYFLPQAQGSNVCIIIYCLFTPDHVVAFPEKLLKTIATRFAIFSLNFTKNCLAARLRLYPLGELKGRRQRISTVGYQMIFRKINTEETFLPFTVITNKEKSSICEIYCRESGRKMEKWNVFTTTIITITTERNTVNHYDKIYCVFEILTNK